MLGDVPIVDLHHHFLPPEVFAQLQKMADGRPRLVNDRISITLNPDIADIDAHLATMDAAGIEIAVLTQSGVSVLGPSTCVALNDGLAEIQSAHGDRIVATAHVDIEDEGAVAELDRCVDELGYRAVALPCSSPRLDLDDASLDPLWARIDELGLPVILHPAQLPRGASLDYGLERSCARPFDTTVAAVRLMCGVLPRFPHLRFVLPHCGGTAVMLRGRLAMFFNKPGEPERSLPRTRREQVRDGTLTAFETVWSKLYFDTAGTGAWSGAVEFTAKIVGVDHMVFGTDFPLEAHSPETMSELVEMLSNLDLGDGEKQAIANGTACSLLRPVLAPLVGRT